MDNKQTHPIEHQGTVQEEARIVLRKAFNSIPTSTATPLITLGAFLLLATIGIKYTPVMFNEMSSDEFTTLLFVSLVLIFGGAGIRVYLYYTTIERSLELTDMKIEAVEQAQKDTNSSGSNLG